MDGVARFMEIAIDLDRAHNIEYERFSEKSPEVIYLLYITLQGIPSFFW